MTCAFKMERPEPFQDLPSGCQFSGRYDETISVDGKEWCPYHCPMADEKGNPTEKSHWSEERVDSFMSAIKIYLNDTRKQDQVKDGTKEWFCDILDLTGVVFPGKVTFAKEVFHQVLFYSATFCEDVDFHESRFSRPVVFSSATFMGSANFFQVSFEQKVWFQKAKFRGNAKFENSTFNQDAFFYEIEFRGVDFSRSTFIQNAKFDESRFQGGAAFFIAKFQGVSSFKKVIFNEYANFEFAVFGNGTSFRGTTFKKSTTFNSPGNIRIKENLNVNMFPLADFEGAFFGADVSFVNRSFPQPARFLACIFSKAPEFHGCQIHQGSLFPPRENFHDVLSDGAAHAYRTLKLAMEQNRSRYEEAMFYALEQESFRMQKAGPWHDRCVSLFYKWTTDYGQSYFLPAIWLVVLLVFSFFVYTWLISIPTGAWFSHTQECAEFTIEQLVRPFSVFLPRGGMSIKEHFGENVYIMNRFKVMAFIESLFSIILITLFVVAIRRRFRFG